MNLDWLHRVLVTLLGVVVLAWWVAWTGWQESARNRELIVLQVKEWQVEELWSEQLDTEWKDWNEERSE